MNSAIKVPEREWMEPVAFAVSELTASGGRAGGEELIVDFSPCHPQDTISPMRRLRIFGVPPEKLLSLVVSACHHASFVLEACHDSSGRVVPAGVMLAAIYGLGREDCLQVESCDFHKPVAVACARVRLRLQEFPLATVADITVEGDSA